MNLSSLLLLQSSNSKTAIKCGDKSLLYSEWNEKSAELSNLIKNICYEDSKCIAMYIPNSIEYAIVYFGIVYSNKVIVPIGTYAKGPEILSTIKYCEVDIIISTSQYKNFLTNTLSEYENRIVVYLIDMEEVIIINEFKNLIAKSDYLNEDNSDDSVVIMLHTSGTTNNPKRVMLTHRNLISNIESNIKSLQLTSEDKVLIALPMFFGYCNTAQFLTHLYLGASMVILDSIFLPKQFFSTIEKEKITNFTAVPSMLLMMLEYRYFNRYNIDSLKYICFGGGSMPPEKLMILINRFPGIQFVQTYGQTECSPRITALLPKHAISKIGSVGLPIPNVDLKIVDENDNFLKENHIGEIVISGENVMKGYYKQPDLTSQSLRNGWLHTGDLGYVDNEGFLYLTGRIKNMIISGGINIYPEEIEQAILENDCIKDICIIGEEHKLLGEVPIAKVVLKKQITENDLKKYCSEKLAYYKVPNRFDFVESIPKTYNGKIKRY
jgi:long-chain acyl-CoA synthetase